MVVTLETKGNKYQFAKIHRNEENYEEEMTKKNVIKIKHRHSYYYIKCDYYNMGNKLKEKPRYWKKLHILKNQLKTN